MSRSRSARQIVEPSAFERFPEEELQAWDSKLRSILLDALQPPAPPPQVVPSIEPLQLSETVQSAYAAAQARSAGNARTPNGSRRSATEETVDSQTSSRSIPRQRREHVALLSGAESDSEEEEEEEEEKEEEEEEDEEDEEEEGEERYTYAVATQYARHPNGNVEYFSQNGQDRLQYAEESDEDDHPQRSAPNPSFVVGSSRGPPGRRAAAPEESDEDEIIALSDESEGEGKYRPSTEINGIYRPEYHGRNEEESEEDEQEEYEEEAGGYEGEGDGQLEDDDQPSSQQYGRSLFEDEDEVVSGSEAPASLPYQTITARSEVIEITEIQDDSEDESDARSEGEGSPGRLEPDEEEEQVPRNRDDGFIDGVPGEPSAQAIPAGPEYASWPIATQDPGAPNDSTQGDQPYNVAHHGDAQFSSDLTARALQTMQYEINSTHSNSGTAIPSASVDAAQVTYESLQRSGLPAASIEAINAVLDASMSSTADLVYQTSNPPPVFPQQGGDVEMEMVNEISDDSGDEADEEDEGELGTTRQGSAEQVTAEDRLPSTSPAVEASAQAESMASSLAQPVISSNEKSGPISALGALAASNIGKEIAPLLPDHTSFPVSAPNFSEHPRSTSPQTLSVPIPVPRDTTSPRVHHANEGTPSGDDDDMLADADDDTLTDGASQKDDVEMMGARQAGVQKDELSCAESEGEDSQADVPDYSGGSSDSDEKEVVQYGDDIEATARQDGDDQQYVSESPPDQSRAASEELPVEATTREELEREIRNHDRHDLPHPTLVGENEEFDDSSDAPVISTDIFAFARDYEVVEEPGNEDGWQGADDNADEERQLNGGMDQTDELDGADDDEDEREGIMGIVDDVGSPETPSAGFPTVEVESGSKDLPVSSSLPPAVDGSGFVAPPRATAMASDGEERSEAAGKQDVPEEGGRNAEASGSDGPHEEADKRGKNFLRPAAMNEATLEDADEGSPETVAVEAPSTPVAQDPPVRQRMTGQPPASPRIAEDVDSPSTRRTYTTNVAHPGQWKPGMPIRFSNAPIGFAEGVSDTETDDGGEEEDNGAAEEHQSSAGQSENMEQEPESTAAGIAARMEEYSPRDHGPIDVPMELDQGHPTDEDNDATGSQQVLAESDPDQDELDIFDGTDVEASEPPESGAGQGQIANSHQEDHSIAALVEHDAPPPPTGHDIEDDDNTAPVIHRPEDDVLVMQPAVLVRHHMHGDDTHIHHPTHTEAHRAAFEAATALIHSPPAPAAELSKAEEGHPTEEQPTAQEHETAGEEQKPPEQQRLQGEEDGGNDHEGPGSEEAAPSSRLYPVVEIPTTPPRARMRTVSATPDPTRHYHGVAPSAAALETQPGQLTSSPAGRTRSKCSYHKVRVNGDSTFPLLIVPGCTVVAPLLKKLDAEDLGQASVEEMRSAVSLRSEGRGDAAVRAVVPDELFHKLRHLVGIEIFREGHSFVLPLGPATRSQNELEPPAESEIGRGILGEGSRQSSVETQSSPATPNRKRKRKQPSPIKEDVESDNEPEHMASSKRRAVEVVIERDAEAQSATQMDVDDQQGPAAGGGLLSWVTNWFTRR